MPWDVDVRVAPHFLTVVESRTVAHGNGILWQKWTVSTFRRELLPQFFTNSHEIWPDVCLMGVDVQDTFFDSGQKVCCHGNGILWQKLGENLR